MDDLISYVIRGSLRKKVFTNLVVPNTPTNLSKKTNIERASVSRALINLSKKGLVVCVNPSEKTGRLYKLTDKGKKVYDIMKKM